MSRRKEILGHPQVGGASILFCLQNMAVKYHYKNRQLWLFGVDSHGYSVAVGLTDFYPSLLVGPCPTIGADLELWRSTVNVDIFESKTNQGCQTEEDDAEEYIRAVVVEERTPLIGFTNGRRDKLFRVICNGLGAYADVLQHLQAGSYKVYHEDWSPLNQFLHQTGFQYQDWLQVTGGADTGLTTCNTERVVSQHSLAKVQMSTTAKVLKCFLRAVAVSQDALVTHKFLMKPIATKPQDRIMAVMLSYQWSDDPACVHRQILSLIPAGVGTSSKYNFTLLATETELMHALKQSIVDWDPDVIMHFGDTLETFVYLAQRAEVSRLPNALAFERFRGNKCQFFSKPHMPPKFRCETRSTIDLVAFLKKKVFISVESYDLATVSCHPELRKTPSQASVFDYGPNDTARFLLLGSPGRRKILAVLVNEVNLMVELEQDCGVWLEQTNIALVSDTPLTNTVEGEQKRVYNKITHSCHDRSFYINRDALARRPLRFSCKQRPPTFPDPSEPAITTELRNNSLAALQERLTRVKKATEATSSVTRRKTPKNKKDHRITNCFESAVHSSGDEKDVDEAEGGNVMHPSPGFWGSEKPIGIFDFASLYPSIMMAFNVSYENLVFDKEYLDLPGVPYINVLINSRETVVLVDQIGLICIILRFLVDSRSAIKKLMKGEKDPFKQSILDKRQNSMKTLCNATYGFCGAGSGSGALLAVKTIMYVVTSIGRYLQKTTASFLAEVYACPTIYGDTDSVFALVPHDRSSTIEHMTLDAGRRYQMDGFLPGGACFNWPNVCLFYQQQALDARLLPFEHRVHAVLYLVYRKLCAEASGRLRKGITLEFENMADNVFMGWVKKHYCYRLWDPSVPGKVKKIKVTGMASKKREYTPWTRAVLEKVTELLLFDKVAEVRPYLETELETLISGKVPITSLKVSRSFNCEAEYKNMNQPHLQVVLKREEREGCKVPANSRVYFVIIEGKDKLFMRSETPEYVQQHGLRLDLMYYLQKQFYKPILRLLTYHDEHVNFQNLFDLYVQRLTMLKTGLSCVTEKTNRKKWTLADFIRSKRVRK